MSNTTSTLLVVGALAAAFSFLAIDSTEVTAGTQDMAWEQPPIAAPRPGSDVIILKGLETVGREQLAWEQPPIAAPRPGAEIIVLKGIETPANATA